MSDNISRKMNGKNNSKTNQQTKSRNEQSLSNKRNLFCFGKFKT